MQYIHQEVVTSTQDEVRALYTTGERGPLFFRADIQTKGRGRLGRAWDSESGNLFATLLYPTTAPANRAVFYGFAAAVAIAQTVAEFDPSQPITLKWPNDVLVGGAKISGILVEREAEALLIGVGLNLVSHPDGTPYPATDLASVSRAKLLLEPNGVLRLLAEKLIAKFTTLETKGFEPLRAEWMAMAHGIGKMIIVGGQSGVFTEMASDGSLCLRREDGTLTSIHTGDVSFG